MCKWGQERLPINKTREKWAHFGCMHTKKGLVRLQHDGRNVHPVIGISAQVGTSLKCLMLGAGQRVSCCVCRATISGVLETWWDSSKGDVLLCMEAGSLGRTSQDNEVGELTFMWECRRNTQSCLVMDEPAECLWVGISRWTNVDDMVGV